MEGYLVLENGEIFEGERIGYNVDTACEIVFNTSMSGYIETFTDPSYAGQGIVMTYPLIGNYGVIPEDCESEGIYAKAVFVHEIAEFESNFRTKLNLDKFLRENKVPGLTNINTRKLTRVLRNSGTMRGYVTSNINNLDEIMEKIKKYEIKNVVEKVTSKSQKSYGRTKAKQIALVDYGFKHNLVNLLLEKDIGVTVYPANTSAEMILATRPDGILLSNGPGNPEDCKEQIEVIKKFYKTNIPILGISLGHQLMGLATGAKTAKLNHGHRGSHPVKDLKTGRVYMTAQNHGYYIEEESINPEVAEVTYTTVTDRCVEGLKYKGKNIVTVQFDPGACPGPEETKYIFDEFAKLVKGGN